ncbi:MAG: alpha-glucosidase [Anaerolineales bacterium]|nr:alpha-glucosidase [Anaerolineales bacterium]
MASPAWWRRAVCYQIYPRSFADSNGDGVGDLPGITAKLDYLQWLGVDALWLSPFHPSPQLDWGYDVADFTAVHPDYGTLADFDELLAEAHRRGLRILLDLVLNHTSDQHPWFQQARAGRDNPYRDWYVWRDGAAGGPPNDWEALFGGSAWELDPASGQYYYHLFFAGQPDLNWRNPEVRAALAAVMRFWLDRGVDGFRLDAINHLFEREDLPNAQVPGRLAELFLDARQGLWAGAAEMVGRKIRFQENQPETHPLMRDLRRLVDSYGDRVLLGETEALAYYGNGADELHSVFNFPLIQPALTAAGLRAVLAQRLAALPAGAWECHTLSNHDRSRSASVFADGRHNAERLRAALALIALLPGTPVLYYGEELGMVDLFPETPEAFKDALAHWAYMALRERPDTGPAEAFDRARRYFCRDICRTPMQWTAGPNAGFAPAGVAPWLPVHPNHAAGVNVAEQQADPASLLNWLRVVLRLRRAQPALRDGELDLIPDTGEVLAFWRRAPEQTCLVALNLSARPAELAADTPLARLIYPVERALAGAEQAGVLRLPPYAVVVVER